MIYPYECTSCGHDFEVYKSYKRIDDPEHCPECSQVATRYISRNIGFSGHNDWDTAHYNLALGQVVKSNAEAKRIARERGMEEIGNEPIEKIHKKFDTERQRKIDTAYDDICSTNLGEIRTK